MTKTATIHAVQKWEYLSVTKKTEEFLAREMNELGQVGWQLVYANQIKDRKGEIAWVAFMTRPYVPNLPKHAASPGETAAPTGQPAASSSPAAAGFNLEGDEFKIKEEEET